MQELLANPKVRKLILIFFCVMIGLPILAFIIIKNPMILIFVGFFIGFIIWQWLKSKDIV